jgi:hypothetical protein
MSQLDGKVAVITGAASGIDLAAVKLFASEGARVYAASPLSSPIRNSLSAIEGTSPQWPANQATWSISAAWRIPSVPGEAGLTSCTPRLAPGFHGCHCRRSPARTLIRSSPSTPGEPCSPSSNCCRCWPTPGRSSSTAPLAQPEALPVPPSMRPAKRPCGPSPGLGRSGRHSARLRHRLLVGGGHLRQRRADPGRPDPSRNPDASRVRPTRPTGGAHHRHQLIRRSKSRNHTYRKETHVQA